MQRIWHDDWLKEQVPFHALMSVVLSDRGRLLSEPALSKPRDKESQALVDQLNRQNLRLLCGLTSVVGISWFMLDRGFAERAGELCDRDGESIALVLGDYAEHQLSAVDDILGNWTAQITARLCEVDSQDSTDLELRPDLCRARVDCGRGRYAVRAYLGDTAGQALACSDLIRWMRLAGDSEDAKEWSQTLVEILRKQGKGKEVAETMYEGGCALFYDGDYEHAANILQQAFLLAFDVGDHMLGERSQQYLRHAEYLLELAEKGLTGGEAGKPPSYK